MLTQRTVAAAAGELRSESLTWRMMGGQCPIALYSVAQLRGALDRDLRRPGVRTTARDAFTEVTYLLAVCEVPPVMPPKPDRGQT
ncbi:hypothetical protein [Kitasatospora indigofera]|uniref:hypothetical protein n=1 Tax=Kitasatospora indigofera TaxID=67307 RepID=UPI0036A0A0E0